MFTVFVTGPLAAGKHSACSFLAQNGFKHIDLDEMAKEFLDDELVSAQLCEAYGEGILTKEGSVDRRELAARAFVDAESAVALNNATWPLVQERLSDIIVGESCQREQAHERLAVEVALLAEVSEHNDFTNLANHILCITAAEQVRIERALARGMLLPDVLNRIALQASDEERLALCDTVIENDGSLESLHKKLDMWLASLDQEHMF